MLLWLWGVAVQTGSGLQVLVQAVSYLMLFGALAWVLKRVRREMTVVDILDASGVMLASGLLLCYIVLDTAGATGKIGTKDLVFLLRPVGDLGLSFLTLRILMMVSSPLEFVLTGGMLLLLISDGLWLTLPVGELRFFLDSWPALYWIFSAVLLAHAALQEGGGAPSSQGGRYPGGTNAWLFWLGSMFPPLQYAVILVWGTLRPPLPGYVLLCGVVLLLVFALRTYAANRAADLLTAKQKTLAKRAEQSRILGELHDTVKQNIRGASMMIEACVHAQRRGDENSVREFLDRSLEMSREAGYQLSKPLDELRLFHKDRAVSTVGFFKERFERFGENFDLAAHEALQAPLEVLNESEIAVAYRVCIEASWNAVKHSGARNLWLESRLVGTTLVVGLRDDGHGFSPEETHEGLGLRFMRSRAEEVGARLRLISALGRGTTVELEFGGR